jgi:hypothetical protein
MAPPPPVKSGPAPAAVAEAPEPSPWEVLEEALRYAIPSNTQRAKALDALKALLGRTDAQNKQEAKTNP